MARKIKRPPNVGKSSRPSSSSVGDMETYEDTLEQGGVDDFMFTRDQILFNDAYQAEQDDDVNGYEGEGVLDISEEEDEGFSDNEDDDVIPSRKSTTKSTKQPNLKRGRFAKEDLDDVSEDEEALESGSSSGSETWGRQYYSRPSNRRAKEDPLDATREEERELEENEVKRLQKKARSELQGEDDWGLTRVMATGADESVNEALPEPVAAPQTDDPAVLLRHLETHQTLKLALSRELPLVVAKLRKTARGIKALPSDQSFHQGLGWLHYQTLLTYASVLAYYLHLAFLPSRPDLSDHPILSRLLHLKQGLSMLEDLDFAAGSVSSIDGDAEVDGIDDDDDDDEAELLDAKRELMQRMFTREDVDAEAQTAEDLDDLDRGDVDESWKSIELEDGELADLLANVEAESAPKARKRKQKFRPIPEDGEPTGTNADRPPTKKSRKRKAQQTPSSASFAPLAEPDFHSFTADPTPLTQDESLDPSSLVEADASDKERRRRSLQFHTAKINSTSARRATARATRYGGDDDVPRRDREAARSAALRKSQPSPIDEPLETPTEPADDDGYYELVQKSRKNNRIERAAQREVSNERHDDATHEGGPRALTRAIEKNRGLTPRRSKYGRNPRVKKRLAYEKAKKKVGSQGPVYKGQASLGGSYGGETSGISSAIRSKRF